MFRNPAGTGALGCFSPVAASASDMNVDGLNLSHNAYAACSQKRIKHHHQHLRFQPRKWLSVSLQSVIVTAAWPGYPMELSAASAAEPLEPPPAQRHA